MGRSGERGGQSASPPLLAIPCVFLIKSPQTGEPALGKGGEIRTHYQDVAVALTLGSGCCEVLAGPCPVWLPRGLQECPFTHVIYSV